MHRAEQELAAAVAREHTAGAVRAVGGRRQAEHDDAGGRVAEPGHRPPPVVVVAERGALGPSDLLAPFDEARAGPAADDFVGDRECSRVRVMIHEDRQ